MLMGMVHVLNGPDHISALATLSSNVFEAFQCVIRWGVGHSSGIVLAGSFIILRYHDDQDSLECINNHQIIMSRPKPNSESTKKISFVRIKSYINKFLGAGFRQNMP